MSMATSDALIVGEDWISEHYFTTDAKSESFQAKVARTAQGLGRGRQERAPRPSARVSSPHAVRLGDVDRRPARRPAGHRTTTACLSCTPTCARCSATRAASTS